MPSESDAEGEAAEKLAAEIERIASGLSPQVRALCVELRNFCPENKSATVLLVLLCLLVLFLPNWISARVKKLRNP